MAFDAGQVFLRVHHSGRQLYEEVFLETGPGVYAERSFGCRSFSDHPPEVTQESYGFDAEPSISPVKKWIGEAKSVDSTQPKIVFF